MQVFVLLLFVLFSPGLLAACEASMVEGSHSSLIETEADFGALEDALDRCYPGEGVAESSNCTQQTVGETTPSTHCTYTVVCTLCDDNLTRKYEALD